MGGWDIVKLIHLKKGEMCGETKEARRGYSRTEVGVSVWVAARAQRDSKGT